MKASNQWILLLSLLSFIFTMIAGFNILRDIAIINRVGVGLLIVAAVQAIIAITAVVTGGEKDKKQNKMKTYLRFGNIPVDKISKVHKSDAVIRNEAGVSVWNCVFVNSVPFPLLPDNTSESGMADYFYFLLGNKPVYLVTGTELKKRGSANEPLLGNDIEIVEEYTDDYEYLKGILRR